MIGDDSVLVIDARATPVMAKELVARIRKVTDKPIRHVLLTHYHAVRVLGAAGYEERVNVIASDVTRGMIVERGRQDMDSEIQRFPRLFRAKETIPGLTWPNLVFHDRMTLWLARARCRSSMPAAATRAATRSPGCPGEGAVRRRPGRVRRHPYCGDAHFGDWPGTLDRLAAFAPQALVPGRGEALTTPAQVGRGIAETRSFLEDVCASPKRGGRRARAEAGLRDRTRRAAAEIRPLGDLRPLHAVRRQPRLRRGQGIDNPRIWTAERDIEMWRALESAAP